MRTEAALCRVKDKLFLVLTSEQFRQVGMVQVVPQLVRSSRSCGLWTGLPWGGGNTTVMISNLKRPLGLQSRNFYLCVLGGRCVVLPAMGVVRAVSHLSGTGRRHLIGTQGAEAALAQLYTHFSRIIPFPLTVYPLTALGTIEATGRKLILLMPFTLPVPQTEICQGWGLGPHLKSLVYLAAFLGVSPQGADSHIKYWLV